MTLKAKIKKLLEIKPQLRNSDKELLLEIFRIKGVGLTQAQEEKIRDLPAFESITRARRKAQEEYEKLQAVEVIKQAKQVKETEYRSEYSNKQGKFNYQ
jgi:hypothetical protein